jgi:hypothetical protein
MNPDKLAIIEAKLDCVMAQGSMILAVVSKLGREEAKRAIERFNLSIDTLNEVVKEAHNDE